MGGVYCRRKGVKADLIAHYKTCVFPALLMDEEYAFCVAGQINRWSADEALEYYINQFWENVFTSA